MIFRLTSPSSNCDKIKVTNVLNELFSSYKVGYSKRAKIKIKEKQCPTPLKFNGSTGYAAGDAIFSAFCNRGDSKVVVHKVSRVWEFRFAFKNAPIALFRNCASGEG